MLESLDEVELGCSLWSRRDPEADYSPCGGTVCGIDNVADELTGETRRRFAVLKRDGSRLVKVWLDADEVDPESMAGPNAASVRDLWRTLCREAGGRRGSPLPDEGDFIRTAVRLYDSQTVRP